MTDSRIEMNEMAYKEDSQDGLSIDVAVIGAGASGLYTGYRLVKGEYTEDSRLPSSVHIFDGNDRIGGRLQSIKLPEMDVIGELGGMHYMSSQQIASTLIEKIFQLDYKTFPLGNPADYFYYLRGQRFQGDAWTKAQSAGQHLDVNYTLDEKDQGYNPDQLCSKAIYNVLVSDPWFVENYGGLVDNPGKYNYDFKITAPQWNDIKVNLTYYKPNSPYNGMKIRDIGFWNLMKDQIGQEGYSFIADADGYYSNTMNWNAAEAMSYIIGDYTVEDAEFRTIENGYDQIAYALAKSYTAAEGSQLWLNNQLVTFEKTPNGDRRYTLKFWNKKGQYSWYVHADKVILAMPKRSLELLDQGNFFFNQITAHQLQTNIDSVFSIPSFKLLMGFEYPWWKRNFGIEAGKSMTDLPMSQCYYFGSDPENAHSMLLASYNDMRTVHFWNSLMRRQSQNHFEDKPTKNAESAKSTMGNRPEFVSHSAAVASKKKLETSSTNEPVPESLVKEALNQIRELHGENIPDPYTVQVKDWSEDPFGGGYHNWRVGVEVNKAMPYMRRPLIDESIHIVGDTYSNQQGWIEGAFCVSEKLLQEWFHLKWPEWLDDTYYLGW